MVKDLGRKANRARTTQRRPRVKQDGSGKHRRRLRVGFIATGILLATFGLGIVLTQGRLDDFGPVAAWRRTQLRPWFENVADRCGIDFHHVSGAAISPRQGTHNDSPLQPSGTDKPMLYFPEIMAGGVCLIDYDRDGYLDVYFVQGGRIVGPRDNVPGNRLYRNDGRGSFIDVTAETGVGDRGYGMGCACGDFDNDGWTDLYVTNVGANVLYRNNGDGTFVDVSRAAGVDDDGFGASAAFVDYDRDGDLDLFMSNYVVWSAETDIRCGTPTDGLGYCGPRHYDAPAPDKLYRNNGDGTFSDVSESSGISSAFGNGLGVVPGDFNGDGWPDLAVANDLTPNQLWINQGNGTFRDVALESGVAFNGYGLAEAGMGIDAQDIDGDLDLDLFMTHFALETNTLYRNVNDFFEDDTLRAGLAASRPFTGFGTALADLNNDGALDIYVVNGRVGNVTGTYHRKEDPFAEPNQLFEGLVNGTFREVMPRGGTAVLLVHTSRGAAFGDFDNDGDIDIFVVNRDAPAYLLENRVGSANHWIAFHVINRFGATALGARVQITVDGADRFREVHLAYSYCASNDPRVYFGLGAAERVDDVVITWPDGARETVGWFAADQIVELRRNKLRDRSGQGVEVTQ